jgi:hypothetical protein
MDEFSKRLLYKAVDDECKWAVNVEMQSLTTRISRTRR